MRLIVVVGVVIAAAFCVSAAEKKVNESTKADTERASAIKGMFTEEKNPPKPDANKPAVSNKKIRIDEATGLPVKEDFDMVGFKQKVLEKCEKNVMEMKDGKRRSIDIQVAVGQFKAIAAHPYVEDAMSMRKEYYSNMALMFGGLAKYKSSMEMYEENNMKSEYAMAKQKYDETKDKLLELVKSQKDYKIEDDKKKGKGKGK